MEGVTPADGLATFIDDFIQGIGGGDGLWDEIEFIGPLLITIFIVVVGYHVLRKVVSKGSRLKAGI